MCATLADKFNQLNQYCARKPAASQLQDQLTGMKLQINDLTRERSRLIGRLNETTSQISQGGVRLIGLSVDQIKQVRSYISTISCGIEQDIAKSTTTAAHVELWRGVLWFALHARTNLRSVANKIVERAGGPVRYAPIR